MLKKSQLLKGTVIVTLAALALSSFAVTGVFATGIGRKAATTPATSRPASTTLSNQALQSDWKSELSRLSFDSAVLRRVDGFIEKITRHLDKKVTVRKEAKHERLLDKLDATLKEADALLAKAQAVVSGHAGFDANGTVTDQAQALKSLQQLGADLDQLRGMVIYRLEHLFG